MQVMPVTLEGRVVRLEPLRLEHALGLFAASQDRDIWPYMSFDPSRSLTIMEEWISGALCEQETGAILPFAIVECATGSPVGSTRYLNIMLRDCGLEIGWTWLARGARKTGVNTECKYLLLRHAFETLGAIRVQFKTDSRNLISQRAIERLGAVKEGVLRNHMITPDGYYRHSVYYSIIDGEWPEVKKHLEQKLSVVP